MKNFNIVFSHPWFLLLLIPIITLTLIPFLRLPKAGRKKPKFYVPVIIRIVAVIIVVFLLSGFSIITKTKDVTTLILADLSDSTKSVREDIEKYVDEITEYSSGKNKMGVIAFADNNIYEVEVSENCKFNSFASEPVAEASNIDVALEYANSLFTNSENARIILLSDGNETKGNACKTALAMANSNLRIDAIYFDTKKQQGKEVQVNKIDMPTSASVGETYDIDITIKSTVASNGKLTLYDEGTKISEQIIDINEGENTYTIKDTPKESGVHSYMAKVTSDNDSLEQNNSMYSYIKVIGSGNILVVDGTDNESSSLMSLISSTYNTDVVKPSSTPKTLAKLREYDAVILMNVDNNDLPEGCDKLLEEYVSKLGRSVLTTGGDNTYHYGNMEKSSFKDMLPVNVNLSNDSEDKTEALMILIDNSSSMEGYFIETAKEAAINTINSLGDNSYVGVISFARHADVIADLTPIKNKDDVIDAVEELQTVQGTYLYEAVYEASKQLDNIEADIKHCIILSDGTPRDSGYDNVVGDMYASGVTTSTILVGYEGNTAILSALAELGGGRFYNVYDIYDLSETMVDESDKAKENYTNIGEYELKICDYSKILDGVTELPKVNGYITTKIKAGASNILYTGSNKPIYAEWNYGVGKVASFTCDLSGEWSNELYMTEDGKKLINNVIKGLLPSSGDASGLEVKVEGDGLESDIEVTSSNTDENSTIKVSAVSPQGEVTTTNLVETAAGTYKGLIDTKDKGIYTLTITQYNKDGEAYDTTETAVASSYAKEYDVFINGGFEKLSNICQIGNGDIYSTTISLMNVTMKDMKKSKDFYVLLSIISLILLLVDLVLRNTKWSFWQKLIRKIIR